MKKALATFIAISFLFSSCKSQKMEPTIINGTKIYTQDNPGFSKTIAQRIGSQFVFLALFNKIDELEKQTLDTILIKLAELIKHEDGERRKHHRKITMDSHLRMITNKFLIYLNKELKLDKDQIHTFLNHSIFCIIQPSIKYGHGVILNEGIILNNADQFAAISAEKPSYQNYLESPTQKKWYQPNENLFFLNEIEILTLRSMSTDNKYIEQCLNGEIKTPAQGFIRLVLKNN